MIINVVITQKLHEIPYHAGNHWNEIINPFLPCEFVSLFLTMFPGQVFCVLFQAMTRASESRRT